MNLIETERLAIRKMQDADDAFIQSLLNEPAFHANIGDKKIRSLEDARGYIRADGLSSNPSPNLGMYLVTLNGDATPIGICGLLKRDQLEHPDIGFALAEEYWGMGYAIEAARAVMDYGLTSLGHSRIVAITSAANAASIRLLEKLGLRYSQKFRLKEDDPEASLFS